MVGNYLSVEDAEAQKALKKIKYANPKCLEIKEDKPTNQSLAGWRQLRRWSAVRTSTFGPMAHAFITTNPLVPPEYYAPKGLDPLVVEMNENAEFSLLDCPGKYTVQVATFTGKVVIKQNEIDEIQSGKKKFESSLTEAAAKAHELAKALRMKGWEAYEFHDRNASIVTVGSFNSVGTPRPDGKIEINPQIHTIIDTFKAKEVKDVKNVSLQTALSQNALPVKYESLIGINFDIQPIPVEVPKRSISTTLNRPRGE